MATNSRRPLGIRVGRPRARITLALLAAASLVSALSPAAVAASSVTSIQETAHLHVVNHNGIQTINETGEGSGTFHCPLSVHLAVAYTQASISFTITCPSEGTLTGKGVASYYLSGSTATFSGNVALTRGTGRYAHVSASSLKVNGSLQRASYALTFSVSGQLHG
jgi:hypothetical protein